VGYFQIADIQFSSPVILAPLAGYSDLPFRLLCREYGAALVVSEMISCHGLVYRQKKTISMLNSSSADQPVSFQLFGSDPDVMGEAAAILNEFSPAIIDINMGCPVRKVTKRGAGAALMKDIKLAETILSKVVANSKVPVTVKTRKGIDSSHTTALDFTRMAQDTGASAICIHGRTWVQGFAGLANWNIVAEAKKISTIPVIGNGDISAYDNGLEKIHVTGCDAVMVGRGALGNPWVFNQQGRPAAIKGILSAVKRHIELMAVHLDTTRQLGYIRNHASRYFFDFPGCSKIRQKIHSCQTISELVDFLFSLG